MKKRKILKNTILIIINLIILLPQIVFAAPDENPMAILPGKQIEYEFYFFEQGSTNSAPNINSINFAMFDNSNRNKDYEEMRKDAQICIAIKNKNATADGYNYITYYGKVKIKPDGTVARNEDNNIITDDNSKVNDKCYDVWTINKFYEMVHNAGEKPDGGNHKEAHIKVDETDNNNPYKHVTNKDGEKITSVCTRYVQINKGSLIVERYHRHYSNIKLKETATLNFDTIWNEWGDIQQILEPANYVLELPNNDKVVTDLECIENEDDTYNPDPELDNISGAIPDGGYNGHMALVAATIEESINNIRTKIKLLADAKERIKEDDIFIEAPIVDNNDLKKSKVSTISLAQMRRIDASYNELEPVKYFVMDKTTKKIQPDKDGEYYYYEPWSFKGTKYDKTSQAHNINNESKVTECSNNIREQSLNEYFFMSYNSYNTLKDSKGNSIECILENTGNIDYSLYPVKTSTCQSGTCCASNYSNGKCMPLYKKTKVNDTWKKLINEYNNDSFRDEIVNNTDKGERCYFETDGSGNIKEDTVALYNITRCEIESEPNAKCKYTRKNNIFAEGEILRKNLHTDLSECNAKPVSPVTPVTPSGTKKKTITDIKVMTPNSTKVGDDNIDFFAIARHLDNYGFMLNNGSTNAYTTGEMPAIYGYEYIPICNEDPKEIDLTCAQPHAVLEKGSKYGGNYCDYYFKSGEQDVVIHFNQRGILKTNLLGTYIKSGQGIEFGITYEDTISMETRDGINIDSLDDSIKKDIRNFVANSELFTKLEKESRIKIYTEGNVEEALPGYWTFYYKDNTEWNKIETSDLGNMLNYFIEKKNVTIKAEYKLKNSYADYNNVSLSTGLVRRYEKDKLSTSDASKYIYDGNRYFTKLSTKTSTNNYVEATLNGLSAFNYSGIEDKKYYWKAEYKCGINCRQEFYDYDGTPNKFKFSTREVNSVNPFPIIAGKESELDWRKKYIGLDANWVAYANGFNPDSSTSVSDGLEEIKTRISKTSGPVPEIEPEYVIELKNKKEINSLKNINNNNNYFNTFGYIEDKISSKYLIQIKDIPTDPPQQIVAKKVADNRIHEIGTCGDKRDLDGSCFCTIAAGENCIYNREE